MAKEGLTAFQAVNRYFEEAARLIDLDEAMYSVLTSTYREISVQIPVRLDDGDHGRGGLRLRWSAGLGHAEILPAPGLVRYAALPTAMT